MNRSMIASASEASHKTIVVLDHGPEFAKQSGIETTCTLKSGKEQVREGSINKSMWTMLTEAALEIRRIVADLFPEGDKQLCYVLSDTMARVITPNWISESGALSHDDLIKALCRFTCPDETGDPVTSGIRNGVSIAVETLSEKTPLQEEATKALNSEDAQRIPLSVTPHNPVMRKSAFLDDVTARLKSQWQAKHRHRRMGMVVKTPDEEEENTERVKNRGTIVVFTSIHSLKGVHELAQYVADHLVDRNCLAANSDGLMQMVDHVDLHIINCFPATTDIPKELVNFRCPHAGALMSVTHVLAKADKTFTPAVQKTIMEIYDLGSTTVSGIPMKEEANTGQSMNYDVELFHKKCVHDQLALRNLIDDDAQTVKWIEGTRGNLYKSVRLRWCTPGKNANYKSDKFPIFQGSSLVTAVQVNSRPVLCLTSFVLQGKNVMLDVVDKGGKTVGEPNLAGRLFSHYLCRDEATQTLQIHIVTLSRGEENPAMELIQAKSGRWEQETQVNCAQMQALCKMNELKIIPKEFGAKTQRGEEINLETARATWTKHTEFYPLNLRDTLVFNVTDKFTEFLEIAQKEDINDADMETAKEFIAQKFAESSRPAGLIPAGARCTEVDGMKLDSTEQQYACAFAELLKYLNNFATPDSAHVELMEFIADLTDAPLPYETRTSTPSTSSATQSPSSSRSSSPVPVPRKRRREASGWPKHESVNLLQMFNDQKYRKYWMNHLDFVGRRNGHSTPADIYVGMTFDADPVREDLDKKKAASAAKNTMD